MRGKHVLFDLPLPVGWTVRNVDSIRSPEQHSCVAGPFGSSISSKYFVEEGVPVIRGSNLTDDLTRFVPSGFVFVSHEQAKKYKAQHVRADDLVFTCWGTVGQVGLIPRGGPYPEYIISNKQLKLRPNNDVADPEYLFYYFASPQMVAHLRGRAIGAAVPGINLGILKALEVVLPPLDTQRRIASILSAYDNLIENNTRRIAILEEMARRIYEEWFVRFRFPGHDQVQKVASELGLIPEGWRVGSLGEAAAINARSIRPADAPLEILYIDIASVVPGAITQKQPYRFSEAPGRARRVVGHGDVIWSCVRPNRRSYALILQPEPALIASTGFAVLSAKSVPYSYLYFAVTTDDFVGFLTNHATGAAYPAVTASTFEAAPFLIPEEEVADQFHAVVAPMLDLSETLKRKNANLRVTRDLLLPKLISGELDVSTLSEPTV